MSLLNTSGIFRVLEKSFSFSFFSDFLDFCFTFRSYKFKCKWHLAQERKAERKRKLQKSTLSMSKNMCVCVCVYETWAVSPQSQMSWQWQWLSRNFNLYECAKCQGTRHDSTGIHFVWGVQIANIIFRYCCMVSRANRAESFEAVAQNIFTSLVSWKHRQRVYLNLFCFRFWDQFYKRLN